MKQGNYNIIAYISENWKQKWWFKFINKSQKNVIISLFLFCAIYTIIALCLFSKLGLLSNLNNVIFSAPDSHTYLKLSNFIVGKTDSISASIVGRRPFLFPLFLGLYNIIGVWGYFLTQFILNIISIILVFITVRKLTKASLVAFIAIFLLASNITFTFITLHAITESLTIFLIVVTMYFMTSYFIESEKKYSFYTLFFLSAATCIKGIFLPFLLLWILFVIYIILKPIFLQKCLIKQDLVLFVIAIVPILIQIIFSYSLTGKATISTAGQDNFINRYFPAVYGFAEVGRFVSYGDSYAEVANKEYPNLTDKIKFLFKDSKNIYATLQTSAYLLGINLISGSIFVRCPELANIINNEKLSKILFIFSFLMNTFYVFLHILFLFIIFQLIALNIERKYKLFYLFSMGLSHSILCLSILTYWQGDRIILVALPVWLILYASAGNRFFSILKKISSIANYS